MQIHENCGYKNLLHMNKDPIFNKNISNLIVLSKQ